MTISGYPVARDGEEFVVRSNGADWLTAWHSPTAVPEGIAHELMAHLWMEEGFEPIYHRALVEAGLV